MSLTPTLFRLALPLFFAALLGCGSGSSTPAAQQSPLQIQALAKNKKFYLVTDGTERELFLKGVNIGATKPGHFPGELAITKQEYLRWFQQIHDMGANTIRVFTAQKPDFYDALHQFNLGKSNPLLFMQGVWVNEEDIATLMDPFASDRKILNNIIADSRDLVDVIHGNAVLPTKRGYASGTYRSDVSKYMVGWIVGVEWEPDMVQNTNAAYPGMSDYDGTHLKTNGARPFEIFLATAGDALIAYELGRYDAQRPLSFVNWVTTDTIEHTNEPLFSEDSVSVDTEKIQAKPLFTAGLFASYNIYPYYPDMFSYQAEYINYVDPAGNRNPYRAYLKDLISRHTLPVLVTEFGIPSARGMAHENLVSGFNQGFADEKTQGRQLASMIDDIHQEGFAGGLIFSWQDEWFKRTWNTMDFDDPELRPYWMNAQTNEQQFGLLSFDPGLTPVVKLDGQATEWPQSALVSTQGNLQLFMLSDEKYVYFMVKDLAQTLEGQSVVIPVDVTPNSGSSLYEAYNFANPADFVVMIDGLSSRILVHSYYDNYYFLYAELSDYLLKHPEYRDPASPYFNRMMLPTSRGLYLPVDQVTVPFTAYETGLLKNGVGDPESLDYNSLSDWHARSNILEVRIPWQLLNFRAPSKAQIMDDFYLRNGFHSLAAPISHLTAGVSSGVGSGEAIAMGRFNLRTWDLPTYHERLKQSYYIVQEKFRSIN